MNIYDVAVVGSFNCDITCMVDSLPSIGETIFSRSCSTAFGGKGANQCTQAARLAANTVFICKVGSKDFGESVFEFCRQEKISPLGITVDEKAITGVAHIMVDSQGENCIVVSPGANYSLSIEDVKGKQDLIKQCKVVVCQNEIKEEVSITALQIAKNHGKITIMNAAPAKEDFNPILFTLSDVFIVNMCEASQISKIKVSNKSDAITAAKLILEKGSKSVIVTMGKDGIVYVSQSEEFYVPATKTEVVDSTGAGDSFVGAIAFFLSKFPKTNMQEILGQACFIATLSVKKVGAQGGMPQACDLHDDIFSKLVS